MARCGLADTTAQGRRVELQDYPSEEVPPVIDWQDVFTGFCKQTNDLFTFLCRVRVEDRSLTEEEVIDGFCAILSNEDWSASWSSRPFDLAAAAGWEYAVVAPMSPI